MDPTQFHEELLGDHEMAEAAVLLIVIAIIVGTATQHLLSRVAPWLPFTPCLLVIGIVLALLEQTFFESVAVFRFVHPSVQMTRSIDGHTLLLLFLPPLLFGDCMGLEW